MLRASVSGAIDYSKFDGRNPLSYVRESAILSVLEADGLAEYAMSQAHTLAAAGASTNFENPGDLMAAARETVAEASRSAYPYLENSGKRKKRGNERERWAAQFGDLNDPAVQQKVKEAEQKMLESAREARAVSENAARTSRRAPTHAPKKRNRRAVSG